LPFVLHSIFVLYYYFTFCNYCNNLITSIKLMIIEDRERVLASPPKIIS